MPAPSIFVFCAVLSMLALLPAGSEPDTPATHAPEDSDSPKFAALSDRFMKDSLALSPTSASQAGYHVHVDPKTGNRIELDAQLDDLSLKLMDDQIGLNLLEFDRIQNYRHNPTVPVELIGNALFLPLTQSYAPHDVRLGHVLSRVRQIPRLIEQVKTYLGDSDPIFISTAIAENDGNIELIQSDIAKEIPGGSALRAEYDHVAPAAIASLKDFSAWLKDDLGKRPSRLTWRLGKDFYAQKFRLVMETDVTPEALLADAESELVEGRAEMLGLALPTQ